MICDVIWRLKCVLTHRNDSVRTLCTIWNNLGATILNLFLIWCAENICAENKIAMNVQSILCTENKNCIQWKYSLEIALCELQNYNCVKCLSYITLKFVLFGGNYLMWRLTWSIDVFFCHRAKSSSYSELASLKAQDFQVSSSLTMYVNIQGEPEKMIPKRYNNTSNICFKYG